MAYFTELSMIGNLARPEGGRLILEPPKAITGFENTGTAVMKGLEEGWVKK